MSRARPAETARRAGARLRSFFALDDDWERPGRGISRGDLYVTLGTAAVSLIVLELMRGIGNLETIEAPPWQQRLLVALTCLPILVRRRWPLAAVVLATAGFGLLSIGQPLINSLLSTQVAYFIVILGGVAWARSRREMLLVVGGIVVLMMLWLAWSFALGNAVRDYVGEAPVPDPHIPAPIAAAGIAFTVNALYFGGAVVGGQFAWRGARQRDRLEQQAATIQAQSEELQERAVVEERLRIARELHDVVAHHVSGMGVQAAAARRVLGRSPEQAEGALAQIESSSREAVTQMRDLLGTLRSVERQGDRHAPQPGLSDLPALVEDRRRLGLDVTIEVVEEVEGAAAQVPPAIGHSLYRTVQEALTNVDRHSSARSARVAVRVRRSDAEVEITDDGRPKGASSGSGMGHLGIRERASSHHGTVEIGPRPTGGFRVRLRVPLASTKEMP